ncbi:EAL domain-containing protein, partial [Escherichia coli]|uniref:EAL domain-containing protein n=1 Tax=Escherichia coli TaxID=562 RepID=UPI0035293822
VSPAEFVPLAEKTALMRPLSDWVLRHAMAQLAQWNARNIPLRLAINVSASDMEDSSFLEEAVRLAKTYDIDLSALELEFTESVLIRDASAVGSVLLRARELGMGIAVDDFGTGYSSLLYLKRLPASELKIDRGFINELAHDSDDAAIVSAIVALGRTLNLKIVAEGVETEAQQEF